jgi:cupin 2 domain-containing protein
MCDTGNIFQLKRLPSGDEEIFETLLQSNNIHIERIISNGQITPADRWYDSENDEWVILLQGEAKLMFEDNQTEELVTGKYILIPAHKKHRVIHTSSEPCCIWLAIHFKNH